MNDWELLIEEALKFKLSNQIFDSLGNITHYKIKSVSNDQIEIERKAPHKKQLLTRNRASNAISKLKNKGKVKNDAKWVGRAAIRATLVHLHPFIHWDKEDGFIYWEKPEYKEDPYEGILENVPNDILERSLIQTFKRENQDKFRKNLFMLYDGKCAISETDVPEVLEAAHIYSFKESGINSNDNGILLRRDLHKLFDDNLIAIDPLTLKVNIHKSLEGSYYQKYKGRMIADRIDGSQINQKYLVFRFNKFKIK